jgi:hypothetical protein
MSPAKILSTTGTNSTVRRVFDQPQKKNTKVMEVSLAFLLPIRVVYQLVVFVVAERIQKG